MARRRTLRTKPSDTASVKFCRAARQRCAALFLVPVILGQARKDEDTDTGKGPDGAVAESGRGDRLFGVGRRHRHRARLGFEHADTPRQYRSPDRR